MQTKRIRTCEFVLSLPCLDKIDTKKIEIEDFFKHLKENKVSLKEIKEILNDVYGGDDND